MQAAPNSSSRCSTFFGFGPSQTEIARDGDRVGSALRFEVCETSVEG